ncbi:MAG: hypothetical protein E6G41_04625 [Actinobacteria bacterium]|nr:MAG: hypothetical protein E6G41_04625 [Actinomycetota bacterium]
MVFEVLSSTLLASGPAGSVVRIGGRCMAQTVGDVPPPKLLVGGLRISPRERASIRVTPEWSPFAVTYPLPAQTPAQGWMLEVAPPSDAALDAATRALETLEAIHARIDQLEARLAALRPIERPLEASSL